MTSLGLVACAGPPSGLDDLALRSARIDGIEEISIELEDGIWEGEPFEEGGASRPMIGLIEDYALRAGFTSVESEEAAVLLWHSTGGSGTRLWLAILESAAGRPRSVATSMIGDRVQVIDFWAEPGEIIVDLIAAGPNDAMCCPGQREQRRYRVADTGLIGTTEILGRGSVTDLRGKTWVLESFGRAESDTVSVEITIEFGQEGSISGNGGCNLYSGSVLDAEGMDFHLSATASTMRRCPEDMTGAESEYFHRLSRVEGFGFLNGRLLLRYTTEQTGDLLVFIARED
jgi:heat shock protein HslJ